MENIQRHLPFSSSKAKVTQPPQSRSQFHLSLPDSLQLHVEESLNLLETYIDAFNNMCAVGTRLADKLGIILKGSIYTEISGQFLSTWKELSDSTNLTNSQIKETEMQLRELHLNLDVGERNNTSPENMKIVGRCLASIIQFQKQLFQSAGQAFYSISQYPFSDDSSNPRECPEDVNINRNDEISENQPNQESLELEPKSVTDISLGFREHFTSLFTKLTQKTPTSQSRFYVNFDTEESHLSEDNLKKDLQTGQIIIHSLKSDRGSNSKESEPSILEEDDEEPVILRRAIRNQKISSSTTSSDDVQDILQLLSCGTGRSCAKPDTYTFRNSPLPNNVFSYGQWKSSQTESSATVHYPSRATYTDKDGLPGADNKPRQLWTNTWGWQHSTTQTLNFNLHNPTFTSFDNNSRIAEEPAPLTTFRQIRRTGYRNNIGQEFTCNEPPDSNLNQRSITDNKSWNGGNESSNSSDEASSNNGHDSENVFTMGFNLAGNDLVASVNQRRRHSSSDCLQNFDDNPSLTCPNYKKRSFGDLPYIGDDKNKNSTWPLKQALAKSISLSSSNHLRFSCEPLRAPLIDCRFGSTASALWTMQEPSYFLPTGIDTENHHHHHKLEKKYPYFGQLAQN